MNKSARFEYWKKPWMKWCTFIAALLYFMMLWRSISEYREVSALDIFSDEARMEYRAETIWRCILDGGSAYLWSSVFLTGCFAKDRRAAHLFEGAALIIFALLLVGAGAAFDIFEHGGRRVFCFVFITLAFASGVYLIFKNRKKEE